MKKLIPMIVFGIVALHTNQVVNANEIISTEKFSNITDYEEYIIKVNDNVETHRHHHRDALWLGTGNNNGMRDQYLCHWDVLGGLKNPYNLEPSRPDVGYWQTVLARCNPE